MGRDREQFCTLVNRKLGERRFIVVSNREPYVHTHNAEGITWSRPVGGLTEALDPVLRATAGCWVAAGTGDADAAVVDEADRIGVPPDAPEYTLRRVWLTDDELKKYYSGFSNGALWPLCHVTFTAPVYRETEWMMYRAVNRKFAEAVIEEAAGGETVVLVQDYHLGLLPAFLREQAPDLTVGLFWHIPWPQYEIFRTCPWGSDILEGMLAGDLLGFHTRDFCDNFLDCARHIQGTSVDEKSGTVTYKGHRVEVAAFPISIDFDRISKQADDFTVELSIQELNETYKLDGKRIGIGTDRTDYTKGIPERLLAYRLFLEENPEWRGRVVFIQSGMPSRTEVSAYQRLGQRIEGLTTDINETFGGVDWQPVITLARHLEPEILNALRRMADFCIVSSLHDGMNLVAKEYAAARNDEDGVLILSRFTGAATELTDALSINPYDTRGFAVAIRTALEMPEQERRRRMKSIRRTISGHTIYDWGADLIGRLMEKGEGA